MTGRYPIRTRFWKGNLSPDKEFGLALNESEEVALRNVQLESHPCTERV